jgi:hypothetical protein
MNFPLLLTRRSFSVGGLSGLLFESPPPGPPLELLARRAFSAGQPVDEGVLSWGITTGTTPSTVTYWERTDASSPDIIQVIEAPAGTWHQSFVSLKGTGDEVWFRLEFQLAARGADDPRTRLAAIISESQALSVYANAGDLEITDHAGAAVFAAGAGGVSDAWRVLDGYVRSDSGVGDGGFRIWIDGASTPTAELSGHTQVLDGAELLLGLGSVQAATTLRLAQMEVFATDPRGVAIPRSRDWAAAAPFRIYTPPVSAIGVRPANPTVADGATAGTAFAALSRTGGAGDGTWSLTGGLASIAEIDGSTLRLTRAVTIADDNGTTGTLRYSGDGAGGSAGDISVTLGVADVTTNLVLAQAQGAGPVTGQLDASQAFVRPRIEPKTTPPTRAMQAMSVIPASEREIGGSVTRCGFEDVVQESDIGVVYVDSLDGGTGVGTFRWAANTNTDNNGNSLNNCKVVVVVFAVSGHCNMDSGIHFERNNRWFAGQTAPVDSNGRAGFLIHGASGNSIRPRRVHADNVRLEHLTFVDGRVPRNSSGNISKREPPYGNLDIFEKGNREYHDVIVRNCHFPFGLDEAVAVNGTKDGSGTELRCEKWYFLDCLFGPPAYNDVHNTRGYNLFGNPGPRRGAVAGCMFVAGRARHPWFRNKIDCWFTSNYHYETTVTYVYKATNYGVRDSPGRGPNETYIAAMGNDCNNGPFFQLRQSRTTPFIAKIDNAKGWVYIFSQDNWANGGPNDTTSEKDYSTLENQPPIWGPRPPFPHEDARAYARQYSGPCPAHPNSVVEWVKDREAAGQSCVWKLSERGECYHPSDWPFQNTQATNGNPQPPTNPHVIGASGRTRMEEWLEAEHIAKGGASEFGFGHRWRFPNGGIVQVDPDGTVSFEPEAMKAGESQTMRIERADGSEATVTCRCV